MTAPSRHERLWRWAGPCVFVIALVTLCVRLDQPRTYVHDECYQAFTAGRLVAGDHNIWNPYATDVDARKFKAKDMTKWTRYEWVHPPGAKLLIGAGW